MKDGPRRLNFKKCIQCRKDKQKCEPTDRVWPGQKCDRCTRKEFDCSESILAGQQMKSDPQMENPNSGAWDLAESTITFNHYVDISTRVMAIGYGIKAMQTYRDFVPAELRNDSITMVPTTMPADFCSNRVLLFQEIHDLIMESASNQISFLLMFLIRDLGLHYRCYCRGSPSCREEELKAPLASLIQKATSLSHFSALLYLQEILSDPQNLLLVSAPAPVGTILDNAVSDTIYNLYSSPANKKANFVLPEVSPGQMVLVLLKRLAPLIPNHHVLKYVATELDFYGRSILHMVLDGDLGDFHLGDFHLSDLDVSTLFSSVDINHQDALGRTPLGVACYWKKESTARIILQYGAKPDLLDSNGRSPLSWAAQRGLIAIVERLLQLKHQEGSSMVYNVDPDSKDNSGQTPLFYAVAEGQVEVVKALLATGRVDPWPRSNDGMGPHTAYNSSSTNLKIWRMLGDAQSVFRDKQLLPQQSDPSTPLLGLLRIPKFNRIPDELLHMSNMSADESTSLHEKCGARRAVLSSPAKITGSGASKVDTISIPQDRFRKREWSEIKSSSGPGSGEFERMLNAPKPWRGSASSASKGSSLNSSLSIRTKEVDYLKDFTCCGKKWLDLHQLLDHQEATHSDISSLVGT